MDKLIYLSIHSRDSLTTHGHGDEVSVVSTKESQENKETPGHREINCKFAAKRDRMSVNYKALEVRKEKKQVLSSL